MRVIQLIDSLRSGGAEKMSVTYANALARRIDASFLCCTRKDGLLKRQLSSDVGYLFLKKKYTLDLQAFFKLRTFVKENKINLIQAHSSSWFLALMVKLSLPQIKLVWHDHYGRESSTRKPGLLKPASKLFDGIIAVNKDLEAWSKKNLYSTKVRYMRNFLPEMSASKGKVELKGGDSFKIISVANFRPQKDHLNLLQAFRKVIEEFPKTTLHLIGKEEHTSYSKNIRSFIELNDFQEKVFIYGEQENIPAMLEQADLGVLSSASEGLPVSLLEYGRSGLPIVSTAVGECAEVIGSAGQLVPSKNPNALARAICFYLWNDIQGKKDGAAFQEEIKNFYSEEGNMAEILNYYRFIVDTETI